MGSRAAEVHAEQATDALIDADIPYTPGSARAALAHRTFRIVWAGAFASNIGTWMQNVALGVLAYQVSHSSAYVAALGFAQMGPLFLLSMVGGALGDVVDRRKLLVACQAEQAIFSLVLAWVAAGAHPSKVALFFCVMAVGVGNALNAPTFSAILPLLVGRRDLPGAVSLQSVQMNLSRVVGPAIGGLILPYVKAAGVFAINSGTYLFVIATLLAVALPRPEPEPGEKGLARVAGGLAVARADPLVRKCLLTIAAISFFCLPFIGLMPVLAAVDLHIKPASALYGGLYALFGLGAAIGAVSVGTVLVGRNRVAIIRVGLVTFAAALVGFGLVGSVAAAYPLALAVGVFYFATVTSLSTLLQENLADSVRSRVMALWIMGFGGTVPLGLMAGGAIASATSVRDVVVGGGVFAALLAVATRLPRGPGRRARAVASG